MNKVFHKSMRMMDIFSSADKSMGLVYTPFELAIDILDQYPIEVWYNPGSKFLDPACDRGTFMLLIKELLLQVGHSERHIVENMLYMWDTDRRHTLIAEKVVNPGSKYRSNVFHGNILEWESDMKFDVVIGNPPYQDGSGQGNNQKLWQLFAQLADNMVKEDGFVSYITPTSWKSPASRVNIVRSLFEENDLQWVTFDVSKYFGGVGSQFSAWMYQKRKNIGKTRIGNNIIDFSKSPYLPEGNNDIVGIHKKVIFDWEGDRLHISRHGLICSSKLKNQPDLVSEVKTNIHQYEYHHTNTKNLWGSKKGNDFDNLKVIFTVSGNAIPVIDYGYKGSSATSRYILAESIEDAKSYHSMMNSKLYQWILSTGKWGGFVNDGVLRMLPKLDTSKIWTNEEIYKHFNLTDEEIAYIESKIK